MAQTTTNYLGRCREDGCDYVIFATAEDVKQGDTFRDVTAGTGVYRVNNANWARCTNRHRVFPVKPVKGTYSEKHQCDSRCLNAKGWDCTCSCGGANHGRGHVATVTNASELHPVTEQAQRARAAVDAKYAPRSEGRHLGEVGKYIRGEVRILRVIERTGSVIFKFITESGDQITWFCADTFAPKWAEGQTMTIRAKVVRHESHERFGNSTIVTYVEEVE
jgi:hypothetical protein